MAYADDERTPAVASRWISPAASGRGRTEGQRISWQEFCDLLISRRKLDRVPWPTDGRAALVDLRTGERFVLADA